MKSARLDPVARTLIEGPSASPILVVDEIDTPQVVGHADLLDAFHNLLVPANAREFVDTYIEHSIRADRILGIATANAIDHLKPSLLDRIFDPPHPGC